MSSAMEEIEHLWNSSFANVFNDTRKRKTLGKRNKVLLIYNGLASMPQFLDHCPFDSPEENNYKRYRDLWFGINAKPVAERHILLFPKEHREWPTTEDFQTALEFVLETPYALSMNLRDSGASLPGHVHFQGVIEEFPCFEDQGNPIGKRGKITVSSLDIPYSGVLVQAAPSRIKELSRLANLRRPYNSIFRAKDKRLFIYLYPRNKAFSSCLDGFKIGAPEMGRLFYAKSKQQYQEWSYKSLMNGLQEVSNTPKDQLFTAEVLSTLR